MRDDVTSFPIGKERGVSECSLAVRIGWQLPLAVTSERKDLLRPPSS